MTDEHPTPDAIMQLGLAFWGSKALLSAIELDLFTMLAQGPLTGETLIANLGLQARGTTDWLDALVSLGMLERTVDEYANTAATGLFLDRSKPSYLGGILEMANTRLYPFWGSLTEALRTGQPQNEAKTGQDFFAALYQDQDRLRQFLHAMTGLSMGAALAIAEKFPWERDHTVIDIGTAEGCLPVQLALRHPQLTGGGALIIYDAIIDDNRRDNTFGLLMSLNMLIETQQGSDYTAAECRAWMADIGFRDSYTEPLAGPDSMVVGIK